MQNRVARGCEQLCMSNQYDAVYYISYEYEYMMQIVYHADVLPRPKKASVPKHIV